MSLSPSDINFYGDELYSALLDLRTVPNLRDRAPGIDPLTIDTPSSDVDGSRHNRVGLPSSNDSHVPQSPLSQPRRGRSYLARKRIANNAETSDHVANEKLWPSISKATSRSKALLP